MMKTQRTQYFIVLQQNILLYGWKFFPNWLLRRHMTFNNETVSRQNLRAGNIAKSMTSKGNSGCLPFTKISGKSGSKVNGTRPFRSSQRKISGSNGTSEKVVLFFPKEYSKQKFVFHFFKAIFGISLTTLRPFSGKRN